MVCLLAAPPALALRRWLGLGLFMLLCLSLGQALKNVVNTKVGERVSLSCCRQIPSSESLHTYRAYWQKNITEVVIAYSEGNLMPKPMNRTEMDPWNLTLWISPVEIMDNGSYNCVLQQKSVVLCVQPVDLFVTADFSKPKITAEETTNSCESTEMVIMCSSHGGYPKAKISGTINNISVEWNASWVSESSLSPYNVTGKLVHNMTKDINITCSIEYDDFATSTSLFLRKKDNCAVPTVLPSYNVITASSIIVIIFILAVLLAARYLPRLVCSHCSKPQDLVGEGVKESTKLPMSSALTSETSSV